MATISIKRKRGRPRRDEPPEINEFDISLIREFSSRPAFYDRSCVHYRNRDYLDLQWEEIAQSLGYSVSLIKDRMIQLRNRYNLEKRRVESQLGDGGVKSQWPLYEYMSFLGDYIKARRPYGYRTKSALSGPMLRQNNISNSRQYYSRFSSEAEDYEGSQNNTSNDTESEFQQPTRNKQLNPLAHSTINHEFLANNGTRSSMQKTEGMPKKVKKEVLEPRKKFRGRRQDLSAEKFKAFGQFLAASLIEMNELDALELVNKFTADLVRSMHNDFQTKAVHNASDNASDSVEISI